MRFLFVGNYYPPHYIGGYELHCARVAEWLAANGHRVRALTSSYRKEGVADGEEERGVEVARDLELRYWTDVADLGFWRREWRDLRRFRRHVAEFRPDLIVLWNMRKLASGIALEAERSGVPVAYHLMDEWAALFREGNGLPQFWARAAKSPWGRAVKPPLRALYRALFTPDASAWRPRSAALVSEALGELMRSHGVGFERTHVSYITYDPKVFAGTADRAADPAGDVCFLWAGRMCEGKGLKTALRALETLDERGRSGWRADFCGPMDDDARDGILRPFLGARDWGGRVRYLGPLPYAEMPRQYREHDAFLFTSEVHEGLPGTIVEAFAAGMAVIGTLTGGTKDVLRPGENCLTYPIGDARALADAMERLVADGALRARLSADVARLARERFASDAVFPRLLEFYQGALRA